MAKKRKTAARKKAAKRFMILVSSCGDISQARNAADDYSGAMSSYSSAEAAKKYVPTVLECYQSDNGDLPGGIFIAEIVATGKPTGMTWDK